MRILTVRSTEPGAGFPSRSASQRCCETRGLGAVTAAVHLGIYLSWGKGEYQVAQKVSVTFACDYDSKEIPEGEHLTRAFSLDGRDYEIDLCEKHSQKFDELLRRFAGHARKVTGRVSRTKRRTAAHRQHSAEIRAWAKASGMEVSDRGRIPAQVIASYEASHH
jgi:hypothetical protein